MAGQPKSRFQFRLRTVFLVFTILAVPLGLVSRQISISRQRQAFLNSHKGAGIGYGPHSEIIDIFLLPSASDDELNTAHRLFPEANVCRAK